MSADPLNTPDRASSHANVDGNLLRVETVLDGHPVVLFQGERVVHTKGEVVLVVVAPAAPPATSRRTAEITRGRSVRPKPSGTAPEGVPTPSIRSSRSRCSDPESPAHTERAICR